jgi:hypothetical protein
MTTVFNKYTHAKAGHVPQNPFILAAVLQRYDRITRECQGTTPFKYREQAYLTATPCPLSARAVQRIAEQAASK